MSKKTTEHETTFSGGVHVQSAVSASISVGVTVVSIFKQELDTK